MAKRVDLIGRRFGRLQVLDYAHREHSKKRYCLCKCDCGSEITVILGSLTQGQSRSCGCLQVELLKARMRKHGLSRSKEYGCWRDMRRRVNSPRCKAYENYGGRGITICQEWQESFEAFYRDMGPCPPGHTLDRKDNDGPYSRENCQWATRKTQAENRRDARRIVIAGEARTVEEAAAMTGIDLSTLAGRLRKGWDPDLALTLPPRKGYRPPIQ